MTIHEPPTVVVRLRNLMESLGNTPLREVIRDIWLDALDLEQELAHWMDETKRLEIELAWREHDTASSGIEEGPVSTGERDLGHDGSDEDGDREPVH